jgi:hypothetical protein
VLLPTPRCQPHPVHLFYPPCAIHLVLPSEPPCATHPVHPVLSTLCYHLSHPMSSRCIHCASTHSTHCALCQPIILPQRQPRCLLRYRVNPLSAHSPRHPVHPLYAVHYAFHVLCRAVIYPLCASPLPILCYPPPPRCAFTSHHVTHSVTVPHAVSISVPNHLLLPVSTSQFVCVHPRRRPLCLSTEQPAVPTGQKFVTLIVKLCILCWK